MVCWKQCLASATILIFSLIIKNVGSGTRLKVTVLAQLCPTLWDPMDCSLPGSSVHGISQARILEWVAIPFSRGSSWPRDQTQVSGTVGRFLTVWNTREAHAWVQIQTSPIISWIMFLNYSNFLCVGFITYKMAIKRHLLWKHVMRIKWVTYMACSHPAPG